MSLEHSKLAWKCYQFSGKTLELLLALAHRAGTGKAMRNGHTVPFGQVRATDKVLMKDLRTRRRQTVYKARKELTAAGIITWELVGNTYGKKNTYPVHLYQFNLDKLTELSVAKNATHKRVRKAIHTDVREAIHTDGGSGAKNATQRVDYRIGANDTPQTIRPVSDGVGVAGVVQSHATSDSGSGVLRTPDADTDVREVFHTQATPTPWEEGVSEGEQGDENIHLAVSLEREWKFLFPLRESDPEHFWRLLSRGYAPEKLFQVIKWFPVSTWTAKINSSEAFMVAFEKGILPSFENYHAKVDETCTHAHAAAWVSQCFAARRHAAMEEHLKAVFERDDGPPDPDDAAEEEAWHAASDLIESGDAVDAAPADDPFAGERVAEEHDPEALFDPDGEELCVVCGKPSETGSPCDDCYKIEHETEDENDPL